MVLYCNTWEIDTEARSFRFMAFKKQFGRAVAEKREAAGISQEELGIRVGNDQAYMSRVESGQMNVTLNTVEKIARIIGVSPSELFEGVAEGE
jgi:transcriptional regulator with XRE-family HTH domain